MAKQVPVITRLDIAEINNAFRVVEKRIDKKLALVQLELSNLSQKEGELRSRLNSELS